MPSIGREKTARLAYCTIQLLIASICQAAKNSTYLDTYQFILPEILAWFDVKFSIPISGAAKLLLRKRILLYRIKESYVCN